MPADHTRKGVGGVAPFGYRWQEGNLVLDEAEARVRKDADLPVAL